mmetsp:Transcript_16149/g.24361  ORF Transcript_16149/g.24361 Transcript_16149/m.24361 type:complete len:341 (+) Transcript_16149:88-1110(+)|eukprot:CAMPEP_0167768164 /NCGR_PEP_ID=MMETSP0110_2-20121227/16482_1 /TAXON_ID=629695 /ORGANISM="Gymnochlora sp., Strain CCMP2014" /LENGTH=340 /DNA_ID=CAMNT_0007656741 /DNA_START=61 /DNA_END=1083 /DNA_ORIENTATION=-
MEHKTARVTSIPPKEEPVYRSAGFGGMATNMGAGLGDIGLNLPDMQPFSQGSNLQLSALAPLHQKAAPSHSSSSLPSLPDDVNTLKLIEFGEKTPSKVFASLKNELDKRKSEYKEDNFKIVGKVLDGNEMFEFSSSLFARTKSDCTLEMKLRKGERICWWEFLIKFADATDGKVHPRLREFVKGYLELPPLGASGQTEEYDGDFVKSCEEMVKTGFVENQTVGLKGLRKVAEYCAQGDSLAKNSAKSIACSIKLASGSKNSSVVRLASDLLLSAVKLYAQDAKDRAEIASSLPGIRQHLSQKHGTKSLDLSEIKGNLSRAIALLDSSSPSSGLVAVDTKV